MFPRQGCLYSGCESAGCRLLVVQCLSGRPYHSPNSVTYLQYVSNQANSTQCLDLSAVEQIQSHHCFGVFFLVSVPIRFTDDWIDFLMWQHSGTLKLFAGKRVRVVSSVFCRSSLCYRCVSKTELEVVRIIFELGRQCFYFCFSLQRQTVFRCFRSVEILRSRDLFIPRSEDQ